METNPGIKHSGRARAGPGRAEDRGATLRGAVTGTREGGRFEGAHCLVQKSMGLALSEEIKTPEIYVFL